MHGLSTLQNPSGMVSESVMRYGKWDKVIGLCNVPIASMMAEPATIGKTLDQFNLRFSRFKSFPLA